jgi:hypothetical protein
MLFPSFDLLRMVAAHPSGSQQLASSPLLPAMVMKTLDVVCDDFIGSNGNGAGGSGNDSDSGGFTACSAPTSSPQALTALRFLATACRHPLLRCKVISLVLTSQANSPSSSFATMINTLGRLSSSAKIKSIHRHALASFCANVITSCCASEDILASSELQSEVMNSYYPSVVLLLDNETKNVEVVVKCLLAVGSVAVNESINVDTKSVLQVNCLVESVLTSVQARWFGKVNDYVDLVLSEVTGAVYNQ